ncbi:hypothetical protein WMY93_033143 [Mugilogobius chulae]|uniref:Ig-like domain-containing protein n=1 Tax=Mugilogobius chulae TaxID=88201 RepID=A0AAW0MM27_9GOBI
MSLVHILVLLVSLQGSEEQQLFVVRSGDTVTLPCGSEATTNCTWIKGAVFRAQPRSRRDTELQNVTESCELQIQHVKENDAGEYICVPFNQSQTTISFLSVVTYADSSRKTVCDVSAYNKRHNCGFMVKWLVESSNQSQFKFRTSQCLAEVIYSLNSSSSSLSCEVTDLNHERVFVLQHPEFQWNQTVEDSLPVVTLLML